MTSELTTGRKNANVLFANEQQRSLRDLATIDQFNAEAIALGARTVLIGGYGIDAHAGHIMRPHDDIDIKLYLPPGTSLQQILEQLPETNWSVTTVPHGETILQDDQTGQRIDVHIFTLNQPALEPTIYVRKPYTNITERVEHVERIIVDSFGNAHRVWVEPISDTAADRIEILSRTPQLGRRKLRRTDFSDLLFLIDHQDFDFLRCQVRLAQLLEHREKLDQVSALSRAESLIKERVSN